MSVSSGDEEGSVSGGDVAVLSSTDATTSTHTGSEPDATHEGSEYGEVPDVGNGCAPEEVAHDGSTDIDDAVGESEGSGSEGGSEAEADGDGSEVDPEALTLSHGTAPRKQPSATAAAARRPRTRSRTRGSAPAPTGTPTRLTPRTRAPA